MVPLWQRKKADVTREEYDKFYQERFGDPDRPQSSSPSPPRAP